MLRAVARDQRIGPYTYVYLVENVREEGDTKQRIMHSRRRKWSLRAVNLAGWRGSVSDRRPVQMVLSLVRGREPTHPLRVCQTRNVEPASDCSEGVTS